MPNLLAEIVANKKMEVARAKASIAPELILETLEPSGRDFCAALVDGRENSRPFLIAEVKRASPSRGQISPGFDLEKIVTAYEQQAAAISVLTDQKYFGGSLEDLSEVDLRTRLPILRKDFIVDEYQILEARQFGADAILLIAAILETEELVHLINFAKSFGMAALVEVHTVADLEKALVTPAKIIGVNNRNLDTLQIDFSAGQVLLGKIPRDKIIVAESGIETATDAADLAGQADAMLVGSSLLSAADLPAKLAELTGRSELTV